VNHSLCPPFQAKILEDYGDEYTELQGDGVIVRKQRSSVSIPMHVGHTLTDRDSWLKHYKPTEDLKEALSMFERQHIMYSLRRHNYDKAETAKHLQIGVSSLYRKMDELNIAKNIGKAEEKPASS
jgi:DNA-binding NtrC family response regulator